MGLRLGCCYIWVCACKRNLTMCMHVFKHRCDILIWICFSWRNTFLRKSTATSLQLVIQMSRLFHALKSSLLPSKQSLAILLFLITLPIILLSSHLLKNRMKKDKKGFISWLWQMNFLACRIWWILVTVFNAFACGQILFHFFFFFTEFCNVVQWKFWANNFLKLTVNQ